VQAYAIDSAIPYNVSITTEVTIIYDTTPPNSGLIDPDSTYENTLTSLTGTATDGAGTISGLDVSNGVKVSIQENAPTGDWWNWSGQFNESQANGWGNASYSGGNWQITSNLPEWDNNVTYKVVVKAIDRANNTEGEPFESYTFTYDAADATATVVSIEENGKYNDVDLAVITGTANIS